MELQLTIVGLLCSVLILGGAISYITWRDRGAGSPTAHYQREPPRASGRLQAPGSLQAPGRSADPSPESVVNPDPSALASTRTTHGAPLGDPARLADGRVEGEWRGTLHANQAAMRDPRMSTLDRAQQLMSSPAFALHLAAQVTDSNTAEDQSRTPPADD